MDSQKLKNFVEEPMANKSVTDLPGVGRTLGSRFHNAGYTKASQVYGQYLVGNRSPVTFENFMKDTTQANRIQTLHCSNALEKYYQRFNS